MPGVSTPYSNTYNKGWRQHPNFSWNVTNPRPPVSQIQPGFRGLRTSQDKGNSSNSSSLSICPDRNQFLLSYR
ncbi:unnamed protein product [Linum trigynum]|uniref:Uncharacterized protein n=1 Tax=Linum trigynum TaxID=586398 RepID=A0AAV2DBH0_9ROSI